MRKTSVFSICSHLAFPMKCPLGLGIDGQWRLVVTCSRDSGMQVILSESNEAPTAIRSCYPCLIPLSFSELKSQSLSLLYTARECSLQEDIMKAMNGHALPVSGTLALTRRMMLRSCTCPCEPRFSLLDIPSPVVQERCLQTVLFCVRTQSNRHSLFLLSISLSLPLCACY